MCQENYNINKRIFKQLTYKYRIKIETLYNDQHLNYTQIGDILGKHRTTISREIKEEKSSPEVIEYKIKQSKFTTTLCYKTIYNYIDKEILYIKRKEQINTMLLHIVHGKEVLMKI